LTICAEASALALANAAGDLAVEAIAVVGLGFGGAADASRVVMPCGSCRQLILETSQLANSNARVLCCNGDLSSIVVSTIAELLPEPFGPENLGLTHQWPIWREELRDRVERLVALRKRR
jgi:cytidine deaminase